MEVAKPLPGGDQRRVAVRPLRPGTGLTDGLTWQEGQHLPALLVDAQHPRGTREAGHVQVL